MFHVAVVIFLHILNWYLRVVRRLYYTTTTTMSVSGHLNVRWVRVNLMDGLLANGWLWMRFARLPRLTHSPHSHRFVLALLLFTDSTLHRRRMQQYTRVGIIPATISSSSEKDIFIKVHWRHIEWIYVTQTAHIWLTMDCETMTEFVRLAGNNKWRLLSNRRRCASDFGS